MDPIEHSADSTPDLEPPRKRYKAANDFLLFDDGDVAICVGSLEMKLHSKTLRDKSDYFAKFEKLPNRFVFNHGKNSNMVEPVTADDNGGGPNTPASESSNTGLGDTTLTLASALLANEDIFRLFYYKPISCDTADSFYSVVTLARRYGCINAIKDGLITALLRVSLRTQIFRHSPDLLLNTAYYLRDDSVFTEALIHTIGQRKCDSNFLPDNLKSLVTRGVIELENNIEKCWEAAMRCCTATSLRSAVAATMMRQYLDKRIPCIFGSPLRTEIYDALAALHRMEDPKPLLELDFITQAETVHHALKTGVDVVWDPLHTSSVCCENNAKEKSIRKGLDYGANGQEVISDLDAMLERVQDEIRPLFEDDRNVGYFTCIEFDGPFPWESMTDDSGNAVDG